MQKKKKIENNDPSINFRLSKGLKQRINKEAGINNLTVSNYIRNLLDSYYDGELFEEEMFEYRRYEFIQSTEFIKLIVWMYSKRNDRKCTSTNNELDGHISTLKNTEMNLPSHLVTEFDKVLQDLLRIKNIKSSYATKQFNFSSSFNDNEFNYELLEKYISELNIIKMGENNV